MKRITLIYRMIFACMAFFAIASCTKTGSSKKNNTGTWQCSIEGDVSVNFKVEGGCDKVFADYIPNLGDGYKGITVEGFDGKQIVSVVLYFKGSYPADPKFNLGLDDHIDFGGMGQYIPDALNNAQSFYSTDDRHFGTCVITSYDQTNQRISGTFSFDAQGYNNGAMLSGVTTSISGSFDNVPIIDLTDPNNPKGPCNGTTGSGLGGNGGTTNGNSSTITFLNPAFTPIDISFNGETKQAPVGGNAIFSGMPGTNGTGTASTSGKTSSGTQVGLPISWSLSQTFPTASGSNVDNTLNVGSDIFFLKIQNKSNNAINKVFVNYGLTNQTEDDISIPNDQNVYSIGYYKAFTNSNVRGENGQLSWSWNSLNLPFTNNQSVTVTATP